MGLRILKVISAVAGVIGDIIGGMLAIAVLLCFIALGCTWICDLAVFIFS